MSDLSQALAGEKRAEILTLGFGVSTAMWALAYISRLLPALLPAWLLFTLLLVCLFIGGALAGCHTERGPRGGLAVGSLASLLNLLILGSVLGSDMPGQIQGAAWIWAPGTVVIGALLGLLGGLVGRRRATIRGGLRLPETGWNALLGGVTAVTTLMLLGAGGLVTSQEAGLAVVDWPNSFGYNMFLYPLSRMTGGIFYEHAHRLLGTLVGLATLVFTIQLQLSETRRQVKALAWLAFCLVVLQGILGGLRVTGTFTLSQSPELTRPSIVLAVIHGVLGQLFFGLILVLSAISTRLWRSSFPARSAATAATDRQLAPLLIAVVSFQLVLGALLRHMNMGVIWHLSFAMVVFLLAVAVGARHWGLYRDLPHLRSLGRALTILIGLQLLLGTGALAVVNGTPELGDIPWWEAGITTIHQSVGAAILGLSVLITTWGRRLLAAEA
jgi:heme a synthase